jgi:hypothetical protein
VLDHLGKTDDGIERCAQLVAHIGEELCARGIGTLGIFFGGGELAFIERALGHVLHDAVERMDLAVRILRAAAFAADEAGIARSGFDAEFHVVIIFLDQGTLEGLIEAGDVAAMDHFVHGLERGFEHAFFNTENAVDFVGPFHFLCADGPVPVAHMADAFGFVQLFFTATQSLFLILDRGDIAARAVKFVII